MPSQAFLQALLVSVIKRIKDKRMVMILGEKLKEVIANDHSAKISQKIYT